jgi:hypothetical protein
MWTANQRTLISFSEFIAKKCPWLETPTNLEEEEENYKDEKLVECAT